MKLTIILASLLWLSIGNAVDCSDPIFKENQIIESYTCKNNDVGNVCVSTGYAEDQDVYGENLIVHVKSNPNSPVHKFTHTFFENKGLFWSEFRERSISNEDMILARAGEEAGRFSSYELWYEWKLNKDNALMTFKAVESYKKIETKLFNLTFDCQKVIP